MPQMNRGWLEHRALVSKVQRERRQSRLQQPRTASSEVLDIFVGLDSLKQPLQAKRTPIPISDTNDEIDFKDLFLEHTQKLREEEEQKKQDEEQRLEE